MRLGSNGDLRFMVAFVWEVLRRLGPITTDMVFGQLPEGLRPWDTLTECHRSWCRAGCPERAGPGCTGIVWEVHKRYRQGLEVCFRVSPESGDWAKWQADQGIINMPLPEGESDGTVNA